MSNVKTEHNIDAPLAKWTEPGSEEKRGTCVDCGVWDKDFRDHFMTHYGVNGGEYSRYSKAYEFGYTHATENRNEDWQMAEPHLKKTWELRGQGAWEDFKDAIQFAWQKVRN